jgi:putative flippase GtrA
VFEPTRWRAPDRNLFRFWAASALSTVATLVALGVLLRASLAPAWANLAAAGAGTLIAYELNRRWVWGVAHPARLRDLGGFVVLALAGLAISTIALFEVGTLLAAHHVAGGVREASLQAVDVVAFGSLAGVRFLMSQALFHPPRPEV